MNLKKIIGFLAMALVVFYIFSDPSGAAGTAHNILDQVKDWGHSASQFVASMTAG